jgi:hypothetical protein
MHIKPAKLFPQFSRADEVEHVTLYAPSLYGTHQTIYNRMSFNFRNASKVMTSYRTVELPR